MSTRRGTSTVAGKMGALLAKSEQNQEREAEVKANLALVSGKDRGRSEGLR
jgi:hypothetical protein